MNRYQKIDKFLTGLIYLLLLIPAILFFAFWTKWYVAILAISILMFITIKAIKNIKYKTEDEYKKIFNIKRWIVIIILLIFINIFSGSGGFMYQNWDYNARNAVMHDLIDYEWPVKYHYEEDDLIYNIVGEEGQLSYYFSYWLPGAAIGKITNFTTANIITFIYQCLLFCSFYYLLSRIFNKNSIWYIVIFCCFSGLDIVGTYFLHPDNGFILGTHIDTWGGSFAYSSFITQLFWVFNQSLPAWILTLLFINDKSFKDIGLYLTLSLLFSPFPTIGLLLIMLYFIILGFNSKKVMERLKECFSVENILALLPFIVLSLFYLNNANSQPKGVILTTGASIFMMFVVIFLEFLLISLLCINRKNWKYVIANTICLVICSQFYLGSGCDFVNRTTIPLLLMIMIYIIENFQNNKSKIRNNLLVVYLTLASITSVSEFYRTYEFYKDNGLMSELNLSDNWKTYGKTVHEDAMQTYIKNFSSPNKRNFISKYIFK